MPAIKSIATLEENLAALARIDPAAKKLWNRAGTPGLRRRKAGFETLLRVIVGQQLSVKAAATIWQRLCVACDPIGEATVLAASDTTLRGAGLSRSKTLYARALATALVDEHLVLAKVHRMADEDAIAALTEIKGIGRWSAECYLLFALGRPDVFPAADLALAVSFQNWHGIDERPNEAALRIHSDAWRPHRSAAARLLWHAYGLNAI
jgi:DNA-3-methyladenine glycosylase II